MRLLRMGFPVALRQNECDMDDEQAAREGERKNERNREREKRREGKGVGDYGKTGERDGNRKDSNEGAGSGKADGRVPCSCQLRMQLPARAARVAVGCPPVSRDVLSTSGGSTLGAVTKVSVRDEDEERPG